MVLCLCSSSAPAGLVFACFAVILYPPLYSPWHFCNAVNPELLPLQVASLLCVLTGWLLNMSICGLGHGHLSALNTFYLGI